MKQMKKNIIVYGLIAGAIVSGVMLISMSYASHCTGNMDFGTSMLMGYATQLIAFSLIYVGTRNYRDKYNGGVIRFGEAFKIGIMISLIASSMYVVSWLIDYFYFIPDFADKYGAQVVNSMKKSGANAADIDKKTKEMADFARMYKNPLYNAAMTYMEILPTGIVVTLISSLVLKKKAK
jgi:Protein of unknown function (DUF4199)